MPKPTKSNYQEFFDWTKEFQANHPGIAVDGEYYDLPGTIVYTTHKLPLTGKGRLEIHVVTPEAQSQFHWRVEITVDDLHAGVYKHILLQTDDTIVETYGKQVIEIDDDAAQKLLELIHHAEALAPQG